MLSLVNLSTFFSLAFGGIYIKYMLIKPAYIGLLLATFLALFVVKRNSIVNISPSLMFILILIFFQTLICQVLNSGELPTTFFYLSVVTIPFIFNAVKCSDRKEGIIYWSLCISLLYYAIETYYRLSNPDFSHLPKDGEDTINAIFYIYKINSIAFEDSNFVSVILVVYYIFTRTCHKLSGLKIKHVIIFEAILLLLIILTFSRSSYLGILLFEFLLFFYGRKTSAFKFIMFLIMLSVIVYGGAGLYHSMMNDQSFLSKFDILQRFLIYWNNASAIDKFLGIGFGNAYNVLNIGAHNIIIAMIIENGLFGFVFYFSLLIYLVVRYRLTSLVILPVTFMGLSFSQIAMPYLYIVISWFIYLNESNDECL